ncbi:hypothetical protein G3N59_20490 [Paraburkholderia sp. Ac-20340]|uniref:hypothetical protein n=1 Tax=Paraburkholderia sp. Ac-20340 TaxID=2703888 RepID=UPI00197FE874|nr:hypothetical protein [Paraburkholderia sp. Ac-20340]MBN3855760.1 hypothetical protein [Paraburkholderia sp. Ac-20340]
MVNGKAPDGGINLILGVLARREARELARSARLGRNGSTLSRVSPPSTPENAHLLGSPDLIGKGFQVPSGGLMERKWSPEKLTFQHLRHVFESPASAPENAHLLDAPRKKLMNSEGYPQAQSAHLQLTISRESSL